MSEQTVRVQRPDLNGNGDPIVLRALGISKVFPGTLALDSVDFNVY